MYMVVEDCKLLVSVIIPCLDEAFSIRACVIQAKEAVAKLGFPYEIIVVDNGSVDDTAAIAEGAGAVVVECKERGYGSAVRFGIEASSGSIIITGDGDGSYDFSNLSPFIYPLVRGGGLVLGNRFNEKSPVPGAMPWSHKVIGNPFLTCFLNRICRSDIKDAHCGLRSFTLATYRRISPTTKGFEFCSEMLIKALKNGIAIEQVPIILHCTHTERRSKLRTYRDGFRNFMVILFFVFGKHTGSRFLYLFKMS